MKKFMKRIALVLSLAMIFAALPMNVFAEDVPETSETRLLAAIEAAQAGDTVVLTEDVVITSDINITKNLTLDLAGHRIYNETAIWDESVSPKVISMISVENGAELTITGNGTIDVIEGDAYAINIKDSSKCIIENGTYYGNVSVIQVVTGECIIKDGAFKIKQNWNGSYRYTINCKDKNFKNGTAKITVTGGSFYKYDPANAKNESPKINLVPEGYVSVKEGDVWSVKSVADVEHNIEASAPTIDTTKENAQATIDPTTNASAVEAAGKEIIDILENDTSTVEQKKEAIDNLSISETAKTTLKDAVDAGKEVTVVITVAAEEKQVTEFEPADVEAIEAAVPAEETVAAYLNISVKSSLIVNGVKVNGTDTTIEQLPQPLAFTVAYPQNVTPVAEGFARIWSVYRNHNGVVTELEVTDNGNGTGVFHTDKFSVYALSYKDIDVRHYHTFASSSFDADKHYYKCECGTTYLAAAHEDANKDTVCEWCGYVMATFTATATSSRVNPNTGVTAEMLN